MSKMRRTIILERMYRKVASPEELALVDRLYSQNNKGSATRVMLEKINRVWDQMIEDNKILWTHPTVSSFEDLSPLVHPLV